MVSWCILAFFEGLWSHGLEITTTYTIPKQPKYIFVLKKPNISNPILDISARVLHLSVEIYSFPLMFWTAEVLGHFVWLKNFQFCVMSKLCFSFQRLSFRILPMSFVSVGCFIVLGFCVIFLVVPKSDHKRTDPPTSHSHASMRYHLSTGIKRRLLTTQAAPHRPNQREWASSPPTL